MTKSTDLIHNDVSKQDVIFFEDGLLGLENLNKYILVSPEEDLPFKYLQSVEDESLALAVINPYLYVQDYSFDIYDDVIEELGIKDPSDILVLSVVVMPKDLTKMTANLAAPILINVNTKKGKQIVLQDSKYEIRLPIFDIFKSILSQEEKIC